MGFQMRIPPPHLPAGSPQRWTRARSPVRTRVKGRGSTTSSQCGTTTAGTRGTSGPCTRTTRDTRGTRGSPPTTSAPVSSTSSGLTPATKGRWIGAEAVVVVIRMIIVLSMLARDIFHLSEIRLFLGVLKFVNPALCVFETNEKWGGGGSDYFMTAQSHVWSKLSLLETHQLVLFNVDCYYVQNLSTVMSES